MKIDLHQQHPWNLTSEQAVRLQLVMRTYVKVEPLAGEIHRVGGVDVGIHAGKGRAALVVLDFPSLEIASQATAEVDLTFPYIPGLLSFREIPPVLTAMEKLDQLPDVWMVDGQGLAHPRRFGIASHLGVLLDQPTIGCAKSVLVGKFEMLGEKPGCTAELCQGEDIIGMALRTRSGSRPLIISSGHRITLNDSVKLVLACGRGYRLPEPTRLAHKLASESD
jgi:deoxyribonuclease V